MSDWMYVLAVYTTLALSLCCGFAALLLAGHENYRRVQKIHNDAFKLWEKNAVAAKAKGREPKPFEGPKVPFKWSLRVVLFATCSVGMWSTCLYIGKHFA